MFSKQGDLLGWGLGPDIQFSEYSRKNIKSYLTIFEVFGEKILKEKKENNIITEKSFYQHRYLLRTDWGNRSFQIRFWAKKIYKEIPALIKANESFERQGQNIFNYRPCQVFLCYIHSYLNSIHALFDKIKDFDETIGTNYYKTIVEASKDFQIDRDLRNIIHHNETPTITFEGSKIRLRFQFPTTGNKRNILTPEKIKPHQDRNGGIAFELMVNSFQYCKGILPFEKWAKKHLEDLPKKEAFLLPISAKRSRIVLLEELMDSIPK